MQWSRPKVFWLTFWLTLALLLGLYLLAQNEARKIALDQAGQLLIDQQIEPQWRALLPQIYTQIDIELGESSQKHIEQSIDRHLDDAFAPVYRQIPQFAAFHYSVVGEYSELLTTLSGDAGGALKQRLFDAVDFSNRLDQAIQNTHLEAKKTIQKALQRVHSSTQIKLGLDQSEAQILQQVSTAIQADVDSRFSQPMLGLRAGTGAIAAVVGKKLASKVSAKVIAKTGLKATGIGGGAATGASIGTAIAPGIGTIIGGAAGAIGAWLITDKAIVELDEYFNRDEFERALSQIIEHEKARLKKHLRLGYADYLEQTKAQSKDSYQRARPVDLIFTD